MGKIMELYEDMENDLIRSNFRHKKGIIMCLGHYTIRFQDLEKQLKASSKVQGIPAKKYNALKKDYEKLEKENLELLEAMADHADVEEPSE
jgi:hypothetical protein